MRVIDSQNEYAIANTMKSENNCRRQNTVVQIDAGTTVLFRLQLMGLLYFRSARCWLLLNSPICVVSTPFGCTTGVSVGGGGSLGVREEDSEEMGWGHLHLQGVFAPSDREEEEREEMISRNRFLMTPLCFLQWLSIRHRFCDCFCGE